MHAMMQRGTPLPDSQRSPLFRPARISTCDAREGAIATSSPSHVANGLQKACADRGGHLGSEGQLFVGGLQKVSNGTFDIKPIAQAGGSKIESASDGKLM